MQLSAYPLTSTPLKVVPAHVKRAWMNKNASHCLPLLIANQSGWFLLNDTDFEVTWDGGETPSSLKINASEGNNPPVSIIGLGVVTWLVPYLFRTSPGYNLSVRGPTNWCKDGIVALDALVETDWATAPFTMNWKITRPNHTIKFEMDEPICMIAPQKQGELSAFQPCIRSTQRHQELYAAVNAWFSSRYEFLGKMREGQTDGWQGHYFRGTSPTGHSATNHETKLDLREFEIEPDSD